MTATCCDQPLLVPPTRCALVGKVHGTVIEIGPGDGSNLRHLSGDVRWIGIEPSSHNRRRLRQTAAHLGQAIDLRDGVAEHLPMPDNSVDAVLGTLVLCSVTDPIRVLSEVRRVLRPGGVYAFEEHVAAPRGTWTLRYQHVSGAARRDLRRLPTQPRHAPRHRRCRVRGRRIDLMVPSRPARYDHPIRLRRRHVLTAHSCTNAGRRQCGRPPSSATVVAMCRASIETQLGPSERAVHHSIIESTTPSRVRGATMAEHSGSADDGTRRR